MPEIKVIQCNSDQELFDVLQLGNPQWRTAKYGDIIYRGQANAEWQLSPSAFRPSTKFGYRYLIQDGISGNPSTQARAEFLALKEFANLADQIGLLVPGDSQIFRESVESPALYRSWPNQEIWQTLAIAQHHGIPTRLLDFSFDPSTAAFFAALGLTADIPTLGTKRTEAEFFAIWAVDLRFIRLVQEITNNQSRIREISVPRATNPNLHAQQGLFLLDTQAAYSETDGEYLSLDSVLCSEVEYWKNRPGDWPTDDPDSVYALPITKIVAPETIAKDLLRRIHRGGRNTAHLAPNYDGVVDALRLIQSENYYT